MVKKYDPRIWKERREDENLQKKYGENWKLAKRSKASPAKKGEKTKPSFSHLIGVRFKVEERKNDVR